MRPIIKATEEALRHVRTEALDHLNASINLDAIHGLTFSFGRGLTGGKSSASVKIRRCS